MSEIKDTRSIADGAVADEDILLDNNDWLRSKNQAASGNINLLKADTSDRLHLGDAATGLPVIMGAQLASDPTGITAGFYYNTTDNTFKFYNGTTWANMGGVDWADPVDSSITPDTDGSYNLGSGTFRFGTLHIDAIDSADFIINSTNSTWWWGGAGASFMLKDGTANNVAFYGSVDTTTNTQATGDVLIQTGTNLGNVGGATSNTGGLYMTTGYADGTATTGNLEFYTGDKDAASTSGGSGEIAFLSGQVAGGVGSVGRILFATGANIGTGNVNDFQFIGGNAAAGNSGGLDYLGGNATGGNSGNVSLRIGTATATQGNFKFLKSGVANNIGDIWTATSTDGFGYWAAPASGANATLSNLTSPTAVNQDLLLDATKTIRLPNDTYLKIRNAADSADLNILKVDAFNRVFLGGGQWMPDTNEAWDFGVAGLAWRNINSALYNIYKSGSSIGQINGTDASPSGLITANTGMMLRTFSPRHLGIFTDNSATADANATKDVRIESGNKTAGTGDSGSLYLQTGTSTGGARGSILLNETSLGAASNGFVWTLQDNATGRGSWVAAPALGANTTLSNLDATTTINQNLNFVYGSGKSVHLDKDVYITGRNSTDTGDIDLIKVDAFNRTTIASGVGQTIQLVNSMWPFSNNNFSLGGSVAWSNVQSFAFTLSSGAGVGKLDIVATTPSGVANTLGLRSLNNTAVSVFTGNSAIADALGTGSLLIETGNKSNAAATAGTGSIFYKTGDSAATASGGSGGFNFTIGTTVSGTQGDFQFLKSGVANTIGDVWTATSTDGKGYWAAAGGGGANTSLSNLSATAVNVDLLPGTNNTLDLGAPTFRFAEGHIANIYSPTIRSATSGNGTFQILTPNNTSTGAIILQTGNASAGNSGDLTIGSGTATGTRGGIICSARYLLLPTAASAPSAPAAGWMYYDSTTNKSYTYDGTTWQAHW